ncbi:MAG: carotenoid 1,2-hydratase [Verrucomicrobiota bacterium]
MKVEIKYSVFGVWLLSGLSLGHADPRDLEWSIPSREYEITFPKDHGSHPDFKIEWWYITGHLFHDKRRFGFQATFFRLGQQPGSGKAGELFGGEHFYMAHMGLSDPENDSFLHEERLNREGWDAGALVGDLNVFNGNWSLRRNGKKMELIGSVRSDASFELTMSPEKGPVIFGEDGISRKGPEGTAASYYITFPRIEVSGTLRLGDQTLEVSGEAWMDHEISSSQLDRNQVGWDWACLQFFDGREIMGYVLRTDDGGASDYSKLVWISEKGELTHLTLDDYDWDHDGDWRSPDTNAVYPVSPGIEVQDPEKGMVRKFRLRPTMKAQEMAGGVGGVSYWEGACDVIDEVTGELVGRAFLEMTGYADDIAEKLR